MTNKFEVAIDKLLAPEDKATIMHALGVTEREIYELALRAMFAPVWEIDCKHCGNKVDLNEFLLKQPWNERAELKEQAEKTGFIIVRLPAIGIETDATKFGRLGDIVVPIETEEKQ